MFLTKLLKEHQLHPATVLDVRPDGAFRKFFDLFLSHALEQAAIVAVVFLEKLLSLRRCGRVAFECARSGAARLGIAGPAEPR